MKLILPALVSALIAVAAWASISQDKKDVIMQTTAAAPAKMKVEVWSDIMCPFCYIGKRNYEQALQQFADSNDIEIVWKSFQLDPDIPADNTDLNVYDYLAKRKGISREQVVGMHKQVTNMAQQAGLEYHLDKTVMANSFNAHRLIQLAKAKGLGDEAEESLFYANFTQGKDFSKTAVLLELGKEIGLTEAEVNEALSNERYSNDVKHDIDEARQLGVTGVPFFVFNRKYAVSGAQAPQSFLQVLQKSHEEWRKENPKTTLEVIQGPACTPEGKCN